MNFIIWTRIKILREAVVEVLEIVYSLYKMETSTKVLFTIVYCHFLRAPLCSIRNPTYVNYIQCILSEFLTQEKDWGTEERSE